MRAAAALVARSASASVTANIGKRKTDECCCCVVCCCFSKKRQRRRYGNEQNSAQQYEQAYGLLDRSAGRARRRRCWFRRRRRRCVCVCVCHRARRMHCDIANENERMKLENRTRHVAFAKRGGKKAIRTTPTIVLDRSIVLTGASERARIAGGCRARSRDEYALLLVRCQCACVCVRFPVHISIEKTNKSIDGTGYRSWSWRKVK